MIVQVIPLVLVLNLIFLTVQIVPSKLVLLLLIALILLKAYKKCFARNTLDTFAFRPLTYKYKDLSQYNLLASFCDMLLKHQNRLANFYFIMINLIFIMLVELFPQLTLGIAVLGVLIMFETGKYLIQQNRFRSQYKIETLKRTTSILFEEHQVKQTPAKSHSLEVPRRKLPPKVNDGFKEI